MTSLSKNEPPAAYGAAPVKGLNWKPWHWAIAGAAALCAVAVVAVVIRQVTVASPPSAGIVNEPNTLPTATPPPKNTHTLPRVESAQPQIDPGKERFTKLIAELRRDAANVVEGPRIIKEIKSKPAGWVVHLPLPSDWESAGDPGRFRGKKEGIAMTVVVAIEKIDPQSGILGNKAKETALIEKHLELDVPEAKLLGKWLDIDQGYSRDGQMMCEFSPRINDRTLLVISKKHVGIKEDVLVAVHATATVTPTDKYLWAHGTSFCKPLLEQIMFCAQPIVDDGKTPSPQNIPPRRPEHPIYWPPNPFGA